MAPSNDPTTPAAQNLGRRGLVVPVALSPRFEGCADHGYSDDLDASRAKRVDVNFALITEELDNTRRSGRIKRL